jgi:hypothetical protein
MLRSRKVDRLGLVAVAMSAILGCTSATPATPSPSALTPPTAFSSVPSLVTSVPASAGATATAAEPSAAPQSQAPQTPTPASQPPASPTAPPSTPPTATPTPSPLLLDWQRVGNPGLDAASDINGSAAAGGRFVAIGEDVDGNAVIWSSGDGRSWSKAALPSLNELSLGDVAAMGNGFVAVGRVLGDSSSIGTVLTSADGQSWQLDDAATLPESYFAHVAVLGSTMMIDDQTDFQVSNDGGKTWSQPALPSGMAQYGVLALTATDTDFWVFASTSGGGKNPPIGIWRSTDGQSWTSVGTLPGLTDAANLSVANGPLGWVAIGSTLTKSLKEVDYAWWSGDGVTWQAAQPAPFGVTDIFADDAGFIAVGNWYPNGSGCVLDPTQAEGVTFTSTDGLLWRRMPEDGWMSKFVEQLRRYNRTLIGIGVDYSQNEDGTGAVWTAKLPPIANDTGPEATNPPMPKEGCGP